MSKIIWSCGNVYAYGDIAHFDDKESFIKAVEESAKTDCEDCGTLSIAYVCIEPMVITERGLQGDTMLPLAATDLTITNYYSAKILWLE